MREAVYIRRSEDLQVGSIYQIARLPQYYIFRLARLVSIDFSQVASTFVEPRGCVYDGENSPVVGMAKPSRRQESFFARPATPVRRTAASPWPVRRGNTRTSRASAHAPPAALVRCVPGSAVRSPSCVPRAWCACTRGARRARSCARPAVTARPEPSRTTRRRPCRRASLRRQSATRARTVCRERATR